jgi:site-specific recombinase XerD
MNSVTTLPEFFLDDPYLPVESKSTATEARNDTEAVSLWLRARGGRSETTFDLYRRQALRFLLWLDEQGLTLSAVKIEHVHAFFAHLAAPPQHWIKPRKANKGVQLLPTQILFQPQSPQSINYTRTVLGLLYAYLMDAGYVRRNPFRLAGSPPVIVTTAPKRLLDLDCWKWLWNWILSLPVDKFHDPKDNARTRWLFALLYHTGIRRQEAASTRMDDFMRRDRYWYLRIVGKGRKERLVSVNTALVGELRLYRQSQSLPDFPVPGENLPVILSINKARITRCLSGRAIGLLVGKIAQRAAQECPDKHFRAQLQRMSTHWMRHTNATHRLLAGASIETTQDELGHADPRTTRIYAKVGDVKRREDAEKLAHLE